MRGRLLENFLAIISNLKFQNTKSNCTITRLTVAIVKTVQCACFPTASLDLALDPPLECLNLVPAPLVHFGGRDIDLGSQCRDLCLAPVLIFGEGPIQDLELLVAQPVLCSPLLADSARFCQWWCIRRHLLSEVVLHDACWSLLRAETETR